MIFTEGGFMPTRSLESDVVGDLLNVEEKVLQALAKRKDISRFAKDEIRSKLNEVKRRKRDHKNNG